MLRGLEAFLRYVTLIAVRFYLLTYLLTVLFLDPTLSGPVRGLPRGPRGVVTLSHYRIKTNTTVYGTKHRDIYIVKQSRETWVCHIVARVCCDFDIFTAFFYL